MNDVQTDNPAEQMIREQLLDRGITDMRVIEAIRAVPRDLFVPARQRENAHSPRPLAIGHGQTISEPYIVGLMTSALRVLPEHRVLELGTGSGYQTAVLARLAKLVFTIERVKPLLDQAFDRLHQTGCSNVKLRHGDGTLGWPEEIPFDRIIITAAAPQVPAQLLLQQLSDGGIAILPAGPGQQQSLIRVLRSGNKLEQDELCLCRFVPLIGKEGWPE
ncbi:MAG TPA: protein-L-isoaspartate(D-aspartate) O-methyltransferase [Tepidisphaeraceae bacterium]|nr:protein-L-isoaspartate(D-aspartate) O-methyltransferase [Tepidisphaeraceae bacterium]